MILCLPSCGLEKSLIRLQNLDIDFMLHINIKSCVTGTSTNEIHMDSLGTSISHYKLRVQYSITDRVHGNSEKS